MAEFRHIIRIANTDLDGNKKIINELRKIKGVSFMFANALCNVANIDKAKKTGYLSDEEIDKFNDIIKNPIKYNIPPWMLNRRKDYETGEDKHLTTGAVSYTHLTLPPS
ncbi:MAG: 30S ribosomal protein S13, partial [Candidatus Woesearchaeota archaeon]|nr:30S ribosomal protein S13 [Candidatus Woesearchaeota archaeon]